MKLKNLLLRLLKDPNYRTKIKIYFSTKSAGEDYDPYEARYTYSNLNPITITGYVRELTSEQAYWKQYGIHQSGTLEVLCEEKYRNYFENANKIEVNSIEYQVFKSGTGGRTAITKRPFKIIRVILSRKD